MPDIIRIITWSIVIKKETGIQFDSFCVFLPSICFLKSSLGILFYIDENVGG